MNIITALLDWGSDGLLHYRQSNRYHHLSGFIIRKKRYLSEELPMITFSILTMAEVWVSIERKIDL